MSIVDEVIQRVNEGLNQSLEKQIIDRLKMIDIEFESREELESFAKSNRCLLVKQQIANGSYDCTLFVDGVSIASWNDEVKIVWDDNKITATMND